MTNLHHDHQEPATAIIPAYNEEKYVGKVLEVLRAVDQIDQIIVVDDGSTDSTAFVINYLGRHDSRIELLRLSDNQGKAGAIVAGTNASQNDLIVFLDADLIGLRPDNIWALIEPVQSGRCAMSLGLFREGRRQTDLTHKLIPFLSGQRCLRWSLFEATPDLNAARWGVEVAFSFYAWRHDYDVMTVSWPGVTHAMRPEKADGFEGYWSHLQMWLDIGKYVAQHLTDHSKPATAADAQPELFDDDGMPLGVASYLYPILPYPLIKLNGNGRRDKGEYENHLHDST